MTDYPIAAYGTVKKGKPNHEYVFGKEANIVGDTIQGYDLYTVNGFPYVVPGDGTIGVDLIYPPYTPEFPYEGDFLSLVDKFEHGWKRIFVVTDGLIEAWLYIGVSNWCCGDMTCRASGILDRFPNHPRIRIESGVY